MVFITVISEKLKQTKAGTVQKLVKLLENFGLPIKDKINPDEVIVTIMRDKKNLGKNLNVILLKEIGKSFIYQTSAQYFLN